MGRANWRVPATSTFSIANSCLPYFLPSGLIIPLPTTTTTLTADIPVTPVCYLTSTPTVTDSPDTIVLASELRDPFYASSIPMAFSIAATTTVAYILLLLLFLPSAPANRPWLQKLATLSVCICLTMAFSYTTSVLQSEYDGYGSSLYTHQNEALKVREIIVEGYPMRIGRVISDLFLWLAQVQTLIRLFPREREKAVIKWAGFFLIVLDTLFSVLQSFVAPGATDGSALDAIPALSYLFQISLSLLYATCVIYYGVAKRRHAWNARQPGVLLIGLLSLLAVMTPLVFFIVDIAQKDLAGWGDYVRWVGAAGASVVVWEWVDRIERGEREEGKEGVLGREVYEEDDDMPSESAHPDDDHSRGAEPPPHIRPVVQRQGSRRTVITTMTERRGERRDLEKGPGLPMVVVPPPMRGTRGSWRGSQMPRDVPLPESRSGTSVSWSGATRSDV